MSFSVLFNFVFAVVIAVKSNLTEKSKLFPLRLDPISFKGYVIQRNKQDALKALSINFVKMVEHGDVPIHLNIYYHIYSAIRWGFPLSRMATND